MAFEILLKFKRAVHVVHGTKLDPALILTTFKTV